MPREYNPHRGSDNPPKRKAAEISTSDPSIPARKKIHLPARENKYPSVNELKKRIRDVNRLLNRGDLAADARIIQERALAGYEKELADETKRRDRSKMIKKYHFVRFLDRKTATKEVNGLIKREQEIKDSDKEPKRKEKELTSVAAKLHRARVNLNYTIYYPLNEKYISIYPGKKDGGGTGDEANGNGEEYNSNTYDGDGQKEKKEERIAAEKQAMLRAVEKCMEDGTLDRLRDGKLNPSSSDGNKVKSGDKKRGGEIDSGRKAAKNKEKHEKSKNEDKRRGEDRMHAAAVETTGNGPIAGDDDESDGGFFEM